MKRVDYDLVIDNFVLHLANSACFNRRETRAIAFVIWMLAGILLVCIRFNLTQINGKRVPFKRST